MSFKRPGTARERDSRGARRHGSKAGRRHTLGPAIETTNTPPPKAPNALVTSRSADHARSSSRRRLSGAGLGGSRPGSAAAASRARRRGAGPEAGLAATPSPGGGGPGAAGGNVKVVWRIRPLNDSELARGGARCVLVKGKGKDARTALVGGATSGLDQARDREGIDAFTFHCEKGCLFSERATQEEVYESAARHIIDDVLEGYNGTIFAYGQTSSGKTHTMEGPDDGGGGDDDGDGKDDLVLLAAERFKAAGRLAAMAREGDRGGGGGGGGCGEGGEGGGRGGGEGGAAVAPEAASKKEEKKDMRGIIPRAVQQIFEGIEAADERLEFTIKASIVEIYLERIRDLIDPSRDRWV